MILSLLIGAILAVLGTVLLFYATHLDSHKNKEIAVATVFGYVALVVAFLCGAISGVSALNTNSVSVTILGAAEAVGSAVVGIWYFLSRMSSDISQGYPSN
jgi:hypothetical protein